nr:transposase [Klebsiella pneumoniae subsp. pneumoniae]
MKELYCADDPAQYQACLIRPVGKIDCDLIHREKPNIDRIVATLGLKEMTQGTLIRKLCTYTTTNPTRRAIFEFDKLIRSIYTLRYLRDPQLERNAPLAKSPRVPPSATLGHCPGRRKELTGRTDIEIEISNQCARLIANTIIFYNSAILSRLVTKYEAAGNSKALALITVSPAAWRHILLNGHFSSAAAQSIDLDAIVAGLELGDGIFSGSVLAAV